MLALSQDIQDMWPASRAPRILHYILQLTPDSTLYAAIALYPDITYMFSWTPHNSQLFSRTPHSGILQPDTGRWSGAQPAPPPPPAASCSVRHHTVASCSVRDYLIELFSQITPGVFSQTPNLCLNKLFGASWPVSTRPWDCRMKQKYVSCILLLRNSCYSNLWGVSVWF